MSLHNVGIVVIGRNEGSRLALCLKSLPQPNEFLVYVDSGSSDGSVERARSWGAHVVELDRTAAFTAARARNAGFKALKGLNPDLSFVQFVDGDCELAVGWLEKAAAFLEDNSEVAVVCGRRRERHPESSLYNRLCDDEWNTPVGQALACGGDSLMRTGMFEAVGGFNPGLIAGEEPELCVRLRQRGWQVWRLDAEMTIHDAAMTRFREWWRRNVRSGFGFAEVSRLHRDAPLGIWRRETARPILWGGILPLLIAAGAVAHPAALIAVAIYPLQTLRVALQRGWTTRGAWRYAAFVTLAKFPECQGVVKFHAGRLLGRRGRIIDYKGGG